MKQRKVSQGLQGKLLIFFLLMSLLPLAAVATIAYQKAKGSLQHEATDMLSDSASKIMNKVDVIIGDRHDDVKAWAALPIFRAALTSRNYREASEVLHLLEKSYDDYKVIMLFDAAGNVVAVSDPAILNNPHFAKYQGDHEWFKRIMSGVPVYVQDVYYSQSANQNTVGFSAPVKNAAGQIIGVITSRYDWSAIEKVVVEEGKSGEGGYTYLVNSEGVVIAHPKKEKVLKENLTKDPNPHFAQLVGKMVKGEQGVGTYTYEGVSKLMAYIPSKGYGDFKGIGWSCATVEPEKEVFSPVYSLRNMMLIIMVLAAVVVAILAVIIARTIATPMIKGVAFAQAVASGDLTQSLAVTTKDEVGDLANALNNMVANLREMVGKVRSTSDQVASAANEISASSGQLTKATHSQASATEETSSTMVQMAASILSVSNNADALASNTEEVSSSIQELGASGEQVAKSAEVMASSVSETSATIEQMTFPSRKWPRTPKILPPPSPRPPLPSNR